jgi:hypothetical protein
LNIVNKDKRGISNDFQVISFGNSLRSRVLHCEGKNLGLALYTMYPILSVYLDVPERFKQS